MNALTELIRTLIAGNGEARIKKAGKNIELATRAAFLCNPVNWLDDAARRASQLTVITHAAKYIHGDSKTTSVWDVQRTPAPYHMVSTLLLESPEIDFVGNGAAMDIAKMLMLDAGEGTVLSQILAGDFSALLPFAGSEEQLQGWGKAFASVMEPGEIRTCKYGKETYFPVGDGYHMLSPLFPTSLYHEIYQRLKNARYSDEAKAAQKAREKGAFHPGEAVFYPDLAAMNMCKSKPGTRSYLNNKRGGRVLLLPCTPPAWKANAERLSDPKQAFERWNFTNPAREPIRAMCNFALNTRHDNIHIKRTVIKLVDWVVDMLIGYLSSVERTEWPENWPEDTALAFGRWLAREWRKHDKKLNCQKTQITDFARRCLPELKALQEATA